MFLARHPSRQTIDRFLLESQDLPLSYGPIGLVSAESARSEDRALPMSPARSEDRALPRPPARSEGRDLPRLPVRQGVDDAIVAIGRGQADFERARAALMAWKQFDIGWVETFPREAPAAVGTVVAVLIRHLGFWSLNGCRVVYCVGCPGDGPRFGFAYGALTNHAEAGEELFEVFLDPQTDEVMYRIRATSWPQTTLARAGQPIVRALQARFRRHSAAAMKRATGAGVASCTVEDAKL